MLRKIKKFIKKRKIRAKYKFKYLTSSLTPRNSDEKSKYTYKLFLNELKKLETSSSPYY